MNVSGNAIYNEQGAMKACSTTLAKWVAEGNDKGTTIAKWPSDDALLKMGLDTIAAYKPMPPAPPAPPAPGSGKYSLVDGVNFCYETAYTDANYATKGWKSGKCPNTFNTIVSTSHETICKGHSEENVKYCPKTEVTILVTKKGVGGTSSPSPSPSPTSFLAYFAKELQGGLRLSVEDGTPPLMCLHCVGSYSRINGLDYSTLRLATAVYCVC